MAVRRAWSRSESSRAAFSSRAAQRPRAAGEGDAPGQLTQPSTLSASLPVSEVTSPAAGGPNPKHLGLLQRSLAVTGQPSTSSQRHVPRIDFGCECCQYMLASTSQQQAPLDMCRLTRRLLPQGALLQSSAMLDGVRRPGRT